MQEFVNQIIGNFGGYLLNIGGALLILIGGWLLALLLAATARKALERTSLDDQLAEKAGIDVEKTNVEAIVGKVVYYTVMLFVLVAVFQALRLTVVTGPLNRLLEKMFAFVPNILAAGGLLLAAWLIASFARFLISKALGATKLDDTLTSQVGLTEEKKVPMSETMANVIYWFILLLFLPAILDALNLQGPLEPIQAMLNDLVGYLPNLFGAGVIVLIGWLVARMVRQIVTGLLVAAQVDDLGERAGLKTVAGEQTLSGIIGTVVYVLILIGVIIAGLEALQIEAISNPTMTMLTTLLNAVPNIFGAMIILGVTYLIGRLVSGLVTTLLTSIGFNKVLGLIGLGEEPGEGQKTPAEIVGYLVLVGLMLFATGEAANMLGFSVITTMIAQFLEFAGQVVLAVIVFGLGLYLAKLLYNIISASGVTNAGFLAQAARLAVIILTTAMALRQMGIADDIVNMAFGLLLGAIAVALALAFGLGGRDLAARKLDTWLQKVQPKEEG